MTAVTRRPRFTRRFRPGSHLRREFTSFAGVDRFLRENKEAVQEARALAEKKCREQEREVSRLLR